MFDWVSDRLSEFMAWLWDALLAIPLFIWEMLLNGLAAVLEAIPVPDFFNTAGGMLAGIPSGVAYFAGVAELGYGLSVVLGAYVLRFTIRRIPLIG